MTESTKPLCVEALEREIQSYIASVGTHLVTGDAEGHGPLKVGEVKSIFHHLTGLFHALACVTGDLDHDDQWGSIQVVAERIGFDFPGFVTILTLLEDQDVDAAVALVVEP